AGDRPRGRRLARQPGPGRGGRGHQRRRRGRRRGARDARHRDEQRGGVPRAPARPRAGAGPRRHGGRGGQRLRARRAAGQRALQGQAPGHEAPARRGARGAGRLRVVVGALRAAGGERGRGRAGQPGARLGGV
ncbi:MAG: FIG006762: Phosphoglycerate mutase family, partial [uncultured Solirubrobacteraceae bacterium]